VGADRFGSKMSCPPALLNVDTECKGGVWIGLVAPSLGLVVNLGEPARYQEDTEDPGVFALLRT
jgi:hypothetical protein